MIEAKTFEIRALATCIPAIAVKVQNERNGSRPNRILDRAGWGREAGIYLIWLTCEGVRDDPNKWPGRTMGTAHQYIKDHWDKLEDGDMVDVARLLGFEAMETDLEDDYEH